MTNVDDSLDGAYLEWLYSQVGIVQNRNPARSYWNLLSQLYTTPFRWFIPNDDNRAEDGKALRALFISETHYQLDDPFNLFYSLDCSVLEMMIALSQRIAFESDGQSSAWFWIFMHNLELDAYSDDVYEISISEEVVDTLKHLNNRTYSKDGVGGIFPLRNADRDQRRVELWYQMQAYLFEGLYETITPRF